MLLSFFFETQNETLHRIAKLLFFETMKVDDDLYIPMIKNQLKVMKSRLNITIIKVENAHNFK